MTLIKFDRATPKQIKYIETLATYLELDIHRRNAHVSSIVLREIKHLDELTKMEASQVIEVFLEWKLKTPSTR